MKLANSMGWTLEACHDGERWSLHVSNDWGHSASLACASDTGEVSDPKKGCEVAIKAPTAKLFDRWMDQYDAFVAMAEKGGV